LLLSAELASATQEVRSGNNHLVPEDWVLVGGAESGEKPKLLSEEGLVGFEKSIENACGSIADEAKTKIAAKVQSSQELLQKAREKFEAAATIVLAESTVRAKKIEEQMQALAVATAHGQFNGKTSVTPIGKCCCVGSSDEDTDCKWYNSAQLTGRLDRFQCPEDVPFEYTDLVRAAVNKSGNSFVDAAKIDQLLAACVNSPAWQERISASEPLAKEATIADAKQVNVQGSHTLLDDNKFDQILQRAQAPLTGQSEDVDDLVFPTDGSLPDTMVTAQPNVKDSSEAEQLNTVQGKLSESTDVNDPNGGRGQLSNYRDEDDDTSPGYTAQDEGTVVGRQASQDGEELSDVDEDTQAKGSPSSEEPVGKESTDLGSSLDQCEGPQGQFSADTPCDNEEGKNGWLQYDKTSTAVAGDGKPAAGRCFLQISRDGGCKPAMKPGDVRECECPVGVEQDLGSSLDQCPGSQGHFSADTPCANAEGENGWLQFVNKEGSATIAGDGKPAAGRCFLQISRDGGCKPAMKPGDVRECECPVDVKQDDTDLASAALDTIGSGTSVPAITLPAGDPAPEATGTDENPSLVPPASTEVPPASAEVPQVPPPSSSGQKNVTIGIKLTINPASHDSESSDVDSAASSLGQASAMLTPGATVLRPGKPANH